MGQSAPLTEKNLPDQSGKIFIVTGSSGGIGKELAQILYGHNAKVYIAARSGEKATQAIETIKRAHPASRGELVYLHLDLADLTTVKASADEFLRNEKELHVLWNNAGVMIPPQGSVTKQGYELQLGTNNLGPFLFTKFLTPILTKTAQTAPPGSVRVVWVSSSSAKRASPTTGGVDMSNLDYKIDHGHWYKYGTSKAGNILHSSEYAKRYGKDGIISMSLDPGMLNTDLYKDMGRYLYFIIRLIALKEPIWGAYTELYGGLSTDISTKDNGGWIEPWGKKSTQRKDIEEARKTQAEGGSGVALAFWTWSEEQVAPYV